MPWLLLMGLAAPAAHAAAEDPGLPVADAESAGTLPVETTTPGTANTGGQPGEDGEAPEAELPASQAEEVDDDQDPEVDTVRLRVRRVDRRMVDLDVGSRQGVRVGDVVRLLPVGDVPRDAVVRELTADGCRAEVVGVMTSIEVGVLGEAKVPRARFEPAPTTQGGGTDGDLPWTAPIEGWDRDLPLLADALTVTPDERPVEVHGRAWAGWDHTEYTEGDLAFDTARVGLSLDVRNPFGRGGELEVELRGIGQFGDDVDDTAVRVERLSYAVGGTREQAQRIQVGRFLQDQFPELGLLDGVEYTYRQGEGTYLGVSAGALPDLSIWRRFGDDLQLSTYVRQDIGADRRLSLGAAYQKTWHDGRPDRDLILGTVDYDPEGPLSVRLGTWFDLYSGSEPTKSSGAELTEARLTVGWYEPTWGLSLNGSRTRWPDIRRFEYVPDPELGLPALGVDRIGVYAWKTFDVDWRLTGRLDTWEDQQASGNGGEVTLALRERLIEHGEVLVGLRSDSGKYVDVTGLRIGASHWSSIGTLRGTLDLNQNEAKGSTAGDVGLDTTALRLYWDRSLGQDWHLSVNGQILVGGSSDGTGIGFTLTRYF